MDAETEMEMEEDEWGLWADEEPVVRQVVIAALMPYKRLVSAETLQAMGAALSDMLVCDPMTARLLGSLKRRGVQVKSGEEAVAELVGLVETPVRTLSKKVGGLS